MAQQDKLVDNIHIIWCGENLNVKLCIHHFYLNHTLPFSYLNSLLPGHKLEWPSFTTAHPVIGHERVKTGTTDMMPIDLPNNCSYLTCQSLGQSESAI